MRILFTAFKGKNNSSKILLDNIDCDIKNKLYLTNSFNKSVEELINKLKNTKYDLIISFGQLKLNSNVIRIEKNGIGDRIYQTNYDYSKLKNDMIKKGFKVIESNQTNYLCNNIYYNGLKYIDEENMDCKMIFIHIPKIKVIKEIEEIANIFNEYVKLK